MFDKVRQEKRNEYKEKCTVRCQETVQQWYNLTMCNNQVCFCLNKTMLLSSCLWGNNITTLIMQLDWRITDVTDQCPEVICARQGVEVAGGDAPAPILLATPWSNGQHCVTQDAWWQTWATHDTPARWCHKTFSISSSLLSPANSWSIASLNYQTSMWMGMHHHIILSGLISVAGLPFALLAKRH